MLTANHVLFEKCTGYERQANDVIWLHFWYNTVTI